ncbi:TonB family protein, partial [uncultured Alistipes sp.]
MKKMVMLLLAFLCLAPAMAEVRAEGVDSVALVPEGRLSELAVAPVFRKGGFEKYWTWVMSRLKYPEDAEARKVEGRVTMRVIVEPDGSVTPGEVLESPDPALTEAVVRIVEGS